MRKSRKSRSFAAALILCISLMAQPLAAGAMTPLQTQQRDAEILLLAADYTGAETALTTILQQAPDDIAAYMDRAKARAEQEKFEQAFQDYRQAIRMMQAESEKDWYSTIVKAIEESGGYAISYQKYSLWLQYFDDVTLSVPASGITYGVDTLNRYKEMCQMFAALYGQLPAEVLQMQLAASSGTTQELQQQKEAKSQAAWQREQQRQAAVAGLDKSFYSTQDATTVRYGGTGIQLTDSEEWTQLFILSQPMQSARCTNHEIVCYVPADTTVQTFVTGVGQGTGWGYAYVGNTYTVHAGETVKILDDSETTDSYYCLTVIGV